MHISRHLVLTVLATALAAAAQDCQEGVDWGARVVCARGVGAANPRQPQAAARPGAIRAAQQLALRNALELVKGITLTSTTTVAQAMTENDEVRSRVEGYVRGFQFGQPHYMDDLTVEVFVQIPLDGVGEQVLPAAVQATPSVRTWGAPREIAPAGNSSSPGLSGGMRASAVYTGIVIDARGMGVLPALAPRVLDPDGHEIYGTAYVSREWAVKYGMAGYAKSLDGARALKDRIGANPAVVRAQRADGPAKTDVVLSAEDAADIRSATQNLKFLEEARVVIVVD